MRLLKLVLHKYKRLRLNLIETLTYEPTAPTQFIIGTNGSGKSSLIHECSPLVPDKNDYEKGGYKHATFDLEGAVYELHSLFNLEGGQHHSFKRDGKELNDGGTVTVQLELVKNYFRYTAEMHALITGEIKFTQMNPGERKRWYTMMANENHEYGVGVFKKITERYNEHRHSLKRAKEQLVIESTKLLPPDQLELLRNESSDLYTRVQKMIEIRQPLLEPADKMIAQSNQVSQALEAIVREVRTNMKRLNHKLPKTVQGLREAIAVENQNQIHLQQQADQYFTDFERAQKLWEAMQATHLENAAQIHQELTECQRTVDSSHKQLQFGDIAMASPEVAIASCDKLLAWWPDVETNLHDNREKNWGRAMFTELTTKIEQLEGRYNQAKGVRDKAIQTIEHHESHSAETAVDCPKCHHKFQPNFSAAILEDAKRRQRESAEVIAGLEQQLLEAKELREQIQSYFANYTAIIQQIRNSPGMEPFLEFVTRENILLHTPRSFTVHLQRFRDDAGIWAKIATAKARIVQVTNLMEMLNNQRQAESGQGIAADRERLERLVGECEFNKQASRSKLTQMQNQLQTLEQLEFSQQRLKAGLAKIDELHLAAADSLRREVFAAMLRDLNSQLALKETALMAAERQLSVIEHISSEVETLTQSTADLKILQQELSPTEGLIAEGIFGFMRTFVEQKNRTVEMLFSYPLVIMPCSNEAGEGVNLNYKFPLKVDGELRSDVSKGSSGMKEVIDLAFVIAAMKARGLGSYPLFLDEFGRTLDPVHKQASVALLISVMELERFEQIFMISHDIVQYGALGKSEICVLHDANVQLPPNCSYNTHVKMT